jgi:hypothetical protein
MKELFCRITTKMVITPCTVGSTNPEISYSFISYITFQEV